MTLWSDSGLPLALPANLSSSTITLDTSTTSRGSVRAAHTFSLHVLPPDFIALARVLVS